MSQKEVPTKKIALIGGARTVALLASVAGFGGLAGVAKLAPKEIMEPAQRIGPPKLTGIRLAKVTKACGGVKS